MPLLTLGIATAATLLFFTYIAMECYRRATYWRRRGVPGPAPRLFTGHLNALWGITNPPVLSLREWTKCYGPVYGIMHGGVPMLVISDAEMVSELLTRQFENFHERKWPSTYGNLDHKAHTNVAIARGSRWKRLRTISDRAFTVANMSRLLPVIHHSAAEMVAHFARASADSDAPKGPKTEQPIVVNQHCIEYLMDVLCRVILGQPESLQFRNPLMEGCMKMLYTGGNNWLEWVGWVLPTLGEFLHHLAAYFVRLNDALFPRQRQNLRTHLHSLVAHKKQERLSKADIQHSSSGVFIDLFLDVETAQDKHRNQNNKNEDNSDPLLLKAKGNGGGKLNESGPYTNWRQPQKMAQLKLLPSEVLANSAFLILAGLDASSVSLMFTCWHLANNPEVQRRLRTEILEKCPDPEPTYEQLNRLPYLDAVMRETLRMLPFSSWAGVGRFCAEDTVLGAGTAHPVRVERRTIIQPDLISIQMAPEVWGPDADKFRPERWLDEQQLVPPVGNDLSENDDEEEEDSDKVEPNKTNAMIDQKQQQSVAAQRRRLFAANWFPFGAGPRKCVGMRLAQVAYKCAVIHLLRRFELQRCAETETKLEYNGYQVVHPVSVTLAFKDLQQM